MTLRDCSWVSPGTSWQVSPRVEKGVSRWVKGFSPVRWVGEGIGALSLVTAVENQVRRVISVAGAIGCGAGFLVEGGVNKDYPRDVSGTRRVPPATLGKCSSPSSNNCSEVEKYRKQMKQNNVLMKLIFEIKKKKKM